VAQNSGWRRGSVICAALSAVMAAAAVIVLVVSLVYSGGQTLAYVRGPGPFFFLGALGLVAAAPLVVRHRWRRFRVLTGLCAVLLSGVVVVFGFSFGSFFVPAAGCAVLAFGAALLAPAG